MQRKITAEMARELGILPKVREELYIEPFLESSKGPERRERIYRRELARIEREYQFVMLNGKRFRVLY